MAFSGFPRDTLYTPTPDPLFGQLLEEIQDLTELKVTLRGMWLLHHKRQGIRAIPLAEFLADTVLLRGLSSAEAGENPVEEIRRGLRQAVRRGTFLVHGSNPEEAVFVLNNDAGQRTLARIKEMGVPFDTGRCRRGPGAAAGAPQHIRAVRRHDRDADAHRGRAAEGSGAALPAGLDSRSLRDSRTGKQAQLAVHFGHTGPLGFGRQRQLAGGKQGRWKAWAKYSAESATEV